MGRRGNDAAAAADAEVYSLLEEATPDELDEVVALLGRSRELLDLFRARRASAAVTDATAETLPATVRPRALVASRAA